MPSGGSTKSASNTTDTAPFDELATATTASRRKVNPDYPGSSGVVAQLEAGGVASGHPDPPPATGSIAYCGRVTQSATCGHQGVAPTTATFLVAQMKSLKKIRGLSALTHLILISS
jgi:hypothetical protein